MRTLLRPHGDGYILEIDRKTIEEWMIDPNEPLEMAAADGVLTLAPANDADREAKVDRAIEKIVRRYGPALKRLAE